MYDVGDMVLVITGRHTGNVGRIVVRKGIQAFGRIGFVYEVDFELGPKGRGYTTQYQQQHLQRIHT